MHYASALFDNSVEDVLYIPLQHTIMYSMIDDLNDLYDVLELSVQDLGHWKDLMVVPYL